MVSRFHHPFEEAINGYLHIDEYDHISGIDIFARTILKELTLPIRTVSDWCKYFYKENWKEIYDEWLEKKSLLVTGVKDMFTITHKLGRQDQVQYISYKLYFTKNRKLIVQYTDITRLIEEEDLLKEYMLALENSEDMFAVINPNYEYTMANQTFLQERINDTAPIVGKTVSEVLGTTTFETIKKQVDRCFDGHPITFRSYYYHHLQGRRDIEVRYFPIFNELGETIRVASIIRDITEIIKAEEDRKRIFDLSLDPICKMDGLGQFIEVNPAWERVLGYRPFDLLFHEWREFVHPEDFDEATFAFRSIHQGKEIKNHEMRFRKRNGDYLWLSWNSYYLEDSDEIISFLRDVTLEKSSQDHLLFIASHDSLTNLHNRRYFMDKFDNISQHVMRHPESFAFIMFDIDNFKTINDVYGHEAGDTVLKLLAKALKNFVRNTDELGRLGGEEFGIILRNIDAKVVEDFAKRLLELVETLSINYQGVQLSITISIGITLYRHGDTVKTLYRRADEALYLTKKAGKNNYTFK